MNKILLIVAFVIFLFIIGPIATIWALNTLFPALNIPLNFETWVAVVIIAGVLKARVEK